MCMLNVNECMSMQHRMPMMMRKFLQIHSKMRRLFTLYNIKHNLIYRSIMKCRIRLLTCLPPHLYSHPHRSTRIIVLLFTLLLIIFLCTHLYMIRDAIYLFRPVFDRKTIFNEISHYHDASLEPDKLCEIHNWNVRKDSIPTVIDVIIFSVELDLLELRLLELWNVVDLFVVVEADRTFSGEAKPLLLEQNLDRFNWAKGKLRHHTIRDALRPLSGRESPFTNESLMRNITSVQVRKYAQPGDLIIMADVDEIPRSSTINLLRHCSGYPTPLHLRLKTYFYSFEFFFSYDDSWRAKVQIFDAKSFNYNHFKMSDYILADAGWHCTFCFRYLADFRFKMNSYSHNDRLMGRTELLTDESIQHRICSGLDVFDMYPEVYSIWEMTQKFGAIPRATSFIDLPRGLLANRIKFRYLLSNGCVREDYKNKNHKNHHHF